MVDQTIASWAKDMGWAGDFSFWETDSTWFCPKQWLVSDDEEDSVAYFAVDAMYADDDREEWLTRLLGAGDERMCFRLTIDYKSLGFATKKAWRNFAVQQNQNLPEIEKAGFQFDAKEGIWALPWKIDAKALADGYSNDTMEDAMGSLTDALGCIQSVSPAFDEMLNAARQQARS